MDVRVRSGVFSLSTSQQIQLARFPASKLSFQRQKQDHQQQQQQQRILVICQSYVKNSSPLRQHQQGTVVITPRVEAQEETKTQELVSKREVLGLKDTNLRSTLEHRLWLLAGCSSLLGILVKSAAATTADSSSWGVAMIAAASAYLLADLATGMYHWGIDNYGDAQTPIFGPQIDAFQGHHSRPWTITKREFANNIHALARPVSVFLLPLLLAPNNAAADAFVGVFLGCVVFSQQFHAWAHMKRSQLPGFVIKLQDLGLLVAPKMHGKHHRAPFSCNYCIVSGICNGLLDRSRVLEALERFIYLNWGYTPRCWVDTPQQWLQEGAYFEEDEQQ